MPNEVPIHEVYETVDAAASREGIDLQKKRAELNQLALKIHAEATDNETGKNGESMTEKDWQDVITGAPHRLKNFLQERNITTGEDLKKFIFGEPEKTNGATQDVDVDVVTDQSSEVMKTQTQYHIKNGKTENLRDPSNRKTILGTAQNGDIFIPVAGTTIYINSAGYEYATVTKQGDESNNQYLMCISDGNVEKKEVQNVEIESASSVDISQTTVDSWPKIEDLTSEQLSYISKNLQSKYVENTDFGDEQRVSTVLQYLYNNGVLKNVLYNKEEELKLNNRVIGIISRDNKFKRYITAFDFNGVQVSEHDDIKNFGYQLSNSSNWKNLNVNDISKNLQEILGLTTDSYEIEIKSDLLIVTLDNDYELRLSKDRTTGLVISIWEVGFLGGRKRKEDFSRLSQVKAYIENIQ